MRTTSHKRLSVQVCNRDMSFVVDLKTTWRERLRGLLGSCPKTAPILIYPCRSIHTIGMRYDLDVAFLNREKQVIRVCRKVAPGEFRSAHSARAVVERPAREGAWLEVGDEIACEREERFIKNKGGLL